MPLTRIMTGRRDFAVLSLATWYDLSVKLQTSVNIYQDISTKTKKLSLWLLAPVRILSSWHHINISINSFVWSLRA